MFGQFIHGSQGTFSYIGSQQSANLCEMTEESLRLLAAQRIVRYGPYGHKMHET